MPRSSVRGSLSETRLAGILRSLSLGRKSGILHLSKEDLSKRIYFKEGSIVFAGSDDEEERLGEVLIRAGKMKRSDLDLALQVMKETGQNLGQTVIEMGFLSPAELKTMALERIKTVIYSLFAWPSGQYSFEERDARVDEGISVSLSTTETIVEGVRRIEDPEVIRGALGDPRGVLRQPKNPLAPYQEGSLSSSVDWILYQANGVSTIEEVVANSPLDEQKTLQSIYALVAAGVLEIEAPHSEPRTSATFAERTRVTTPASTTAAGSALGSIPQRLGRYEVQEVLGRGAMGAVLLARDPAIDRVVAVKLIQTAVHLSAEELEKYRERFYREAKAAGKLLHPSIVTIFDVGHAEGETPFIVMEYVEGRTLQEVLKTEKLKLEDALRIAGDVLDALAYAHSQGVVHRDIKPANILLTPDGRAKIMDFGIAHVVGSELTQADEVLGSPYYMAPEQLSRGTIDQRTDLFALGVVLYRLLTGKLPFTGDSFAAIGKAVLFEEPAPPHSINPAVSPALGRIALRCLAKEPAARYATAEEVKGALASRETPETPEAKDAHDPGAPLLVPASSGTSGRVSSPVVGTATRTDIASRPSAKVAADSTSRRRFQAALVLPALLGVGLVVFVLFPRAKTPDEAVAQQPGSPPAQGDERKPATATEGAPGGQGIPDPALETPRPEGDPSRPDVQANPPEPTEAELYHEASLALERGDLQLSKARLEELLRRNPGFAGAAELLVRVTDRLRSVEGRPATVVKPVEERTPSLPLALSDPQLFYEARSALERGDLEGSKARVETLLRRSPSFPGASELLAEVGDRLWRKTLPLRVRAKHGHRIGGCEGTVTFAAWGIRYSSADHEWEWKFDEIRVMERANRRSFYVETYEKDVLVLGKPKSYRFALRDSLGDDVWSRYQRLAKKAN